MAPKKPNRVTCGGYRSRVVIEAAVRKGQQPRDRPDELWARIELVLPVVPRCADHLGRRWLDNRNVLCRILFVLYTGIPWESLPQATDHDGLRRSHCRARPVAPWRWLIAAAARNQDVSDQMLPLDQTFMAFLSDDLEA
jgi:transposase